MAGPSSKDLRSFFKSIVKLISNQCSDFKIGDVFSISPSSDLILNEVEAKR